MRKTIRLFFLLASASFFLGLFAKITKDIFERDELEKIDKAILLLTEKIRFPVFNGVAVDLTALGSPAVITIVTLIGMTILWLNNDRPGIKYLGICSLGAGAWTWIAKHVVGRERPHIVSRLVEVSGQSYPSGHTLAAASVYLGLAILSCRYFKSVKARLIIIMFAMFLIGIVGLSRLYLGVHYPSDIASGVFLGVAWTLFLTGLFSNRLS